MRTFILPTKDTSIYKVYPNNAAGFDEILEIGKLENTGDWKPVRGLIYFPIVPADLPAGFSAKLRLNFASASNLDNTQTLYAYPVSESWVEGTSYFYQTPKNVQDGATWNSASTTAAWFTTGSSWITSVSGAVTLVDQPLTDVSMDVTDIVTDISSSTIPNYGFVLKLDDDTEASLIDKANCKFFGKQTHTIFGPLLEICVDNEPFVTGSLVVLPSASAEIATTTLKRTYHATETARIRFLARDKYPPKVFDLSQRYRAKFCLPQNSYYEIRDVAANTAVLPADEFSRISCDANGSFFTLDTTWLFINRTYAIWLKIDYGTELEWIRVGEFRVK